MKISSLQLLGPKPWLSSLSPPCFSTHIQSWQLHFRHVCGLQPVLTVTYLLGYGHSAPPVLSGAASAPPASHLTPSWLIPAGSSQRKPVSISVTAHYPCVPNSNTSRRLRGKGKTLYALQLSLNAPAPSVPEEIRPGRLPSGGAGCERPQLASPWAPGGSGLWRERGTAF